MKSIFSKKKESTFEEDIHSFWDFGEQRSPTNKELSLIKNILDKRLVIIKGKPIESKNSSSKSDDVFSEILSDYESNKNQFNNSIGQEDEVLDPSKLDKYFSSSTIDKLHREDEKGVENAPTIEIKKEGDNQSIDLSKHFNLQEEDDDDFSSNYFSKEDSMYTPPLNTMEINESSVNDNSVDLENNTDSSTSDVLNTDRELSLNTDFANNESEIIEHSETEENQSVLDENSEIKSQAVELSSLDDSAEIEEVKMDESTQLSKYDTVDERTEAQVETELPVDFIEDQIGADANENEESDIHKYEPNSLESNEDKAAINEEIEEFSVSFDEDELYSDYDNEWAKDDQIIADDLETEFASTVEENERSEMTNSENLSSPILPENLSEFQNTSESQKLQIIETMDAELSTHVSNDIDTKQNQSNETNEINTENSITEDFKSGINKLNEEETSVNTVAEITDQKIQNIEENYRKKVNTVYGILNDKFQKFKAAHASESNLADLKIEIQSLITIAEQNELNFLQQFFIQLDNAISQIQSQPDKKADINNLLYKALQIDILDKNEAVVLEKTNIVAVYIHSLETKIERQRENFKDLSEHKQMIDGKIQKIDRSQRKIVRLNK